MKRALGLTVAEDSRLHQETDAVEAKMPEAEVPPKRFFVGFSQVGIAIGDLRQCRRKSCWGLGKVRVAVGDTRGQVVGRIDGGTDGSSSGIIPESAQRQIGFGLLKRLARVLLECACGADE